MFATAKNLAKYY